MPSFDEIRGLVFDVKQRFKCTDPTDSYDRLTSKIAAEALDTLLEHLDGSQCRYCGENCPVQPDNSEYLCDGFAGDIDGLYAETSVPF